MESTIVATTIRKIYNPVQKDYVTFLKTSEETNGAYSLLEVELAAGGGVGLHYHKSYSESFHCKAGILGVQIEKEIVYLKPGDKRTAEIGQRHRFFNDTNTPCIFICTVEPASRGFEQTLQIGYGLAQAGKVDKKSMPKNFLHLGCLVTMSDTWLTGWRSIFNFFVVRWYKKAVEKGVDKDLVRAFVQY